MKNKSLLAVGVLLFLCGAFFYFRWSSQIRQPLGFSHPQHVKQKIECATCHKEPDTVPAVDSCRGCHPGIAAAQTATWIRVYRVAPDIIFTHDKHTQDSCATCHSQMTAPKRWVHESRFTMDFCMNCHAERRAANECRTCHKNR